jgi:hypothetical protein
MLRNRPDRTITYCSGVFIPASFPFLLQEQPYISVAFGAGECYWSLVQNAFAAHGLDCSRLKLAKMHRLPPNLNPSGRASDWLTLPFIPRDWLSLIPRKFLKFQA